MWRDAASKRVGAQSEEEELESLFATLGQRSSVVVAFLVSALFLPFALALLFFFGAGSPLALESSLAFICLTPSETETTSS